MKLALRHLRVRTNLELQKITPPAEKVRPPKFLFPSAQASEGSTGRLKHSQWQARDQEALWEALGGDLRQVRGLETVLPCSSSAQKISNECLLGAYCAPVSFDTVDLIAGRDSPILQTGKQTY